MSSEKSPTLALGMTLVRISCINMYLLSYSLDKPGIALYGDKGGRAQQQPQPPELLKH